MSQKFQAPRGTHDVLPSEATWYSCGRSFSPTISIVNTSPARCTRCPAGASLRLSLPSQPGCRAGSAISSKIRSGIAAISRLALTTRGMGEAEAKQVPVLIDAALMKSGDEAALAKIHGEVRELCQRFPLYA